MGPKWSHAVLWSFCSGLVSLRRGQGVSAAARVQPSGPQLKSSSPVVPGRGSLRHPLVPAGLPSSIFRRSGLAPSHLSVLFLPPFLLALLPDLCVKSPLFFHPERWGSALSPPLFTCDPSPLQELVDDKSVSPAFSAKSRSRPLLQPGASSALRREVRFEVASPVREQQRRSQFLALPQFAGLSELQRTGGGLAVGLE